jgi:cytochrome c553
VRVDKGSFSFMRVSLRLLILLSMALFSALFLGYVMMTPGLRPTVISVYEGPLLQVENRVIDLGTVTTDQKARTEFLIYNQGGKHLRLFRVEPSCGCTVPSISQQVVAPGDFARISVVLDTSLKLGKIRKKLTLYSNDAKRPQLPLFLIGKAEPGKMAGHAPIAMVSRDRLALFKGNCASCHVQQGVGKTGQALFVADCAMCHGLNAQGNLPSGPSLLKGSGDDEHEMDRLTHVIAQGSAHNTQMPPFSSQNGGPLNQAQIDSLIVFLKIRRLNPEALQAEDGEPGDETLLKQALANPH